MKINQATAKSDLTTLDPGVVRLFLSVVQKSEAIPDFSFPNEFANENPSQWTNLQNSVYCRQGDLQDCTNFRKSDETI